MINIECLFKITLNIIYNNIEVLDNKKVNKKKKFLKLFKSLYRKNSLIFNFN